MDGSDIKMETITGEAAAAETAAVEQVATVDGTAGASGLALEVGTELDALASSIQLQEELVSKFQLRRQADGSCWMSVCL